MHFVNKDGGKIKGAFQAVNRILGGVLGAGIGFLAFGFILMCYTSIVAVLEYEGDMDAAIASLDSISAWMMNNNVFQKIVDALTGAKDAVQGAAEGAAAMLR